MGLRSCKLRKDGPKIAQDAECGPMRRHTQQRDDAEQRGLLPAASAIERLNHVLPHSDIGASGCLGMSNHAAVTQCVDEIGRIESRPNGPTQENCQDLWGKYFVRHKERFPRSAGGKTAMLPGMSSPDER